MPDDPPAERRYDKRGRDITARIAAMKAKNPKPASGTPAGGEGWGGAASGDRPRGEKSEPFTDEMGGNFFQRDPVTGRFLPSPATMTKAQVEAEACDFYARVKRNEDESTINRLAGADKWAERAVGKPQMADKDRETLERVAYRWAKEDE